MFNLREGLWYYIVNNCISGTTERELLTQYILVTAGFVLASMLVGYLLGSINSAIIVSKVMYRDDIRRHGSGNAGLTNMFRTYGKKAAGLTLLGDLLKTAISVVFGCVLGGFSYFGGINGSWCCDFPLGYIAGFFAIIGHIFPIYYKFKGGKGVLCAAVMALILTPVEFLILFGVFVLIVSLTKYISLGSVTVAVLYPVVVSGHIKILDTLSEEAVIRQNGVLALITILIAIFIVYFHKENLKRISQGTERKFSFKKKPEVQDGSDDGGK